MFFYIFLGTLGSLFLICEGLQSSCEKVMIFDEHPGGLRLRQYGQVVLKGLSVGPPSSIQVTPLGNQDTGYSTQNTGIEGYQCKDTGLKHV